MILALYDAEQISSFPHYGLVAEVKIKTGKGAKVIMVQTKKSYNYEFVKNARK